MEKKEIVDKDGLVEASNTSLVLAIVPLLMLASFCSWVGLLDMSLSIVTNCLRTFVQLTMLGAVLRPIFLMGRPWLVTLCAFFMVVLAAMESSSRTKYHFEGQCFCILGSLLFNVSWVACLGFVAIIRPRPLWNPRYVIPIAGMLLGNSISGVSLSLNAITTALVERRAEIELHLSFGASRHEAVARLARDGIQVGATPILNMMRVIGIISIPGMMTGQTLGGSPAMVAARYQMLIVYLIALSTLSAILMNAWTAASVAFDSHQVLRADLFAKNRSLGLLATILWLLTTIGSWQTGMTGLGDLVSSPQGATNFTNVDDVLKQPKGVIDIRSLRESCPSIPSESQQLAALEIARSVHDSSGHRRVLFENVSLTASPGDMLLVNGPSGVGKSTLLRTIAGLGPVHGGTLQFAGQSWNALSGQQWRRHVRHVSQSKVDIPGTPREFLDRITSFLSWKDESALTADGVLENTLEHVVKWGLKPDSLDKEWSMLSGGEAQRVIVALAMASKPAVLLLDECTSGLDLPTKLLLEESVKEFVSSHTGGVLWVSHDSQQAERMSHYETTAESEDSSYPQRLGLATRTFTPKMLLGHTLSHSINRGHD